jgi:homoserine kinase
MKAKVTVPATTANLGPGFDCLGMALDLTNTFVLEMAEAGILSVTADGEGAATLPGDASNLLVKAAYFLFDAVGKRPSGLRLHCHNHIPVGSGLGSSATAVLGGMLAANTLLGAPLTPQEVLALAIAYEGHPDNVAPALWGGLTLSVPQGEGWHVEPIATPPMQVAYVLPQFALSTAAARHALPTAVSLADATFNAGRVGLLVHALAAGDFAKLAIAMQDRLHQPYRIPLVPGMAAAMDAAQEAGAAGVAISGAGPGVVAFASAGHSAIVAAMQAAFAGAGIASRAWVLPMASSGAVVS